MEEEKGKEAVTQDPYKVHVAYYEQARNAELMRVKMEQFLRERGYTRLEHDTWVAPGAFTGKDFTAEHDAIRVFTEQLINEAGGKDAA